MGNENAVKEFFSQVAFLLLCCACRMKLVS